ncbi:glycosyltransferase [Glutamicibacter arilaitensis]|uniref:glycosyltransferase n=1 Tax=Glutamicibacter arilaitensis TaxID=256701 RepID=UPI003FD40FD0
MKILVYPHDMSVGGSQLNAVELAAGVRDLGHEVTVVGQYGPLRSHIRDLGLEFIELPPISRRPTPSIVRTLHQIVRDRDIDIVHGYEWPPSLEAFLACQRTRARPVSTVMSMSVAPFIPAKMPLIVGTEQIAAVERATRGDLVMLMEPPVDTAANAPEAVMDPECQALEHGLDPAKLTLAIVSRLAPEMKLEGVLAAIEFVGRFKGGQPLQLLVVGDGPAFGTVRRAADEVNARCGDTRILLTGEQADPRWAYAIADVVLGMGGSALRGMSMGKPLVVQGEHGYWRALTPNSVQDFYWHGWYGIGDDLVRGTLNLENELAPLLADASRRRELGRYARQVIDERYSLDVAAVRQVSHYQQVLRDPNPPSVLSRDALRSGYRLAKYEFDRQLSRLRGRLTSDDFNATPVASQQRVRA